ncbi:MAG: hypothetical protein ACKOXB_07650 [Flavobacteriales bacterium]
MLAKITEQLRKVSEGALRLYIEGYSSNKRGRDPEWIEKSLDFSLSGIKKGSTILEINAPDLSFVLGSYQQPLFDELQIGDDGLKKQTAISLAMSAYERVLDKNADISGFDKNLLKAMVGFNKLFQGNKGEFIDLRIPSEHKKIKLVPKKLKQIEVIEESTPPDQRIKITGKLEMLRHSNNQMELVTINGKIKAFLGSDSIKTAAAFFGKDVTVDGIAHFNPKGKVVSFEIIEIHSADKAASYFQNNPIAIQEQLDLSILLEEQNFKGANKSKFNQLIDELDIQDDLDSLLESLNS